jgi:hypothetical protein
VQLPRDPQPGLIDVHHVRAGQAVTDPLDELRIRQGVTGPGVGGGDRTGRHHHPEQITHRLRSVGLHPEQRLLQIHRRSIDPGPVLHRRVDPVRRRARRDTPTAAATRHDPMPGDPDPDLGQVEHLPHRHPGHRGNTQIVTTPATTGRLMRQPRVRDGNLPQRPAIMTRLPPRPPPRPRPQRLRRRLAQPVRRRGFRRVRRALPQPGQQIRILRPQHRVLPPQPGVLRPQHSVVPLKPANPLIQPGKPLQQLHDERRPGHPP